jgi:uncharacterized heparinase superfamily protein
MRFRFLNKEREVAGIVAWNDSSVPKLWLYNLHYFDDLNAEGAQARKEWHFILVRRWIEENPPADGNGWEPFPTSLRIVNWVKWTIAGNALPEGASQSLAVQARCLDQSIETHLLGNHLFANAKALVFAGLFFEGGEADRWLAKGLALLRREVPEQILKDGGHFERSPMYHSMILEGLLDLVNLSRSYGGSASAGCRGLVPAWEEMARRMLPWLGAMCHPDGEIALFNDAAFGVEPSPLELESYAQRLGLFSGVYPRDGVTHLSESGYVRFQKDDVVALLDVAPLGPDYLPGHGHADTLSFEMSLNGRRILVDTGTSRYDECPERLFQRGTAAHNTVVVDDADSSEVWGSFRVARRARPFGLGIKESDEETVMECSHDGYRRLPGKVVHKRRWVFGPGRLRVEDSLEGRFRIAEARFLLHPSVAEASRDSLETDSPAGSGTWRVPGGKTLRWRVEGGYGRFAGAIYHPEFGVSEGTVRLVVPFSGQRNVFELTWD